MQHAHNPHNFVPVIVHPSMQMPPPPQQMQTYPPFHGGDMPFLHPQQQNGMPMMPPHQNGGPPPMMQPSPQFMGMPPPGHVPPPFMQPPQHQNGGSPCMPPQLPPQQHGGSPFMMIPQQNSGPMMQQPHQQDGGPSFMPPQQQNGGPPFMHPPQPFMGMPPPQQFAGPPPQSPNQQQLPPQYGPHMMPPQPPPNPNQQHQQPYIGPPQHANQQPPIGPLPLHTNHQQQQYSPSPPPVFFPPAQQQQPPPPQFNQPSPPIYHQRSPPPSVNTKAPPQHHYSAHNLSPSMYVNHHQPNDRNIAPPPPSSHAYAQQPPSTYDENQEPTEVWETEYVFQENLVSSTKSSTSSKVKPKSLFPSKSSDSESDSESDSSSIASEPLSPIKSPEPSPPAEDDFNISEYHVATKCGLVPDAHTPLELKYLPEETLSHEQYFRLRDYILGLSWGVDTHETDDDEAGAAPNRNKIDDLEIPCDVTAKEMTVGKTHVNYAQRKYVTEQQVMVRLKDEHRTHMRLLYKFLNRFGYINVGVQPPPHIMQQLLKRQEINSQNGDADVMVDAPDASASDAAPDTPVAVTSETAQHQIDAEVLPDATPRRKRVIVIGAGMSGLLAARQLTNFGYDVIILEGRDRVGGRAYSDSTTGVDYGASIITGVVGNPATLFSEDLQMVRIRGELGGLYDTRSGKRVNKSDDQAIETEFNQLLEKSCDYRNRENGKEDEWRQFMSSVLSAENRTSVKNASLGETLAHHIDIYLKTRYGDDSEKMEDMRRLMYWHVANLEYGLGTHINNVSLCEWDQDDQYDIPSGHYYYARGYNALSKKIASDMNVGVQLNIRFNTEVTRIDYSNRDQNGNVTVRVHTRTNTNTLLNPVQITSVAIEESTDPPSHIEELVFEADKVLVTASLGILKTDRIQFNPPLPVWKKQCIDRLGFGLLNKIVLYFNESFWEGQDYLGMVQEMDCYGKGYLIWNMEPATGHPVLSCLVAGDSALQHESDIMEHPQGIVQFVMQRLRKIYGAKKVPNPERITLTRWKSDPFAMGTYSYVACGATGNDYDIMAKSVNDTIFFGGEATCRTHPSTVFGALLSGMREAGKIDASFHPNDLCIPENEKRLNKTRRLAALAASRKRKATHGYKRSVFSSRKRRRLDEVSERDHVQQQKLKEMVRSLPVIPKRSTKKGAEAVGTSNSISPSAASTRTTNSSTAPSQTPVDPSPIAIESSRREFQPAKQTNPGKRHLSPPPPPSRLRVRQYSNHFDNNSTTPNSSVAPSGDATQNPVESIEEILRTVSRAQAEASRPLHFIIVKKIASRVNIDDLKRLFHKFAPKSIRRSESDYYVEFDETNADWAMRVLFGKRVSGVDLDIERQTLHPKQLPKWKVDLPSKMRSATQQKEQSEMDKSSGRSTSQSKQQEKDQIKSELQKLVTPTFETLLNKGLIASRDKMRELRSKLLKKIIPREMSVASIRKEKVVSYSKKWCEVKLKIQEMEW